jgi:hypothetical protein
MAPDGSVFVSDSDNGAIRRISVDGRIDTLSGGDGSFINPTGIVVDPRLGMIFGEADGRLFSINAPALDISVPGWSNPR